MKIGVFWNSFPFNNISENKIKETLYYYLIGKNTEHEKFSAFFENATIDSLSISLHPKDIINDENSIINKEQFQDFDALFILAELDWHDHKLTDFYGIELAQQIRLHYISAPIFICSFTSEEVLIKKYTADMLMSMGHYFIHLPLGLTNDYPVRNLDAMELKDIQYHCCNLKGRISKIFHESKPADKKIDDDFNNACSIILDGYNKIGNIPNVSEEVKNELGHLTREVQSLQRSFEEVVAKNEYSEKIKNISEVLKKHLSKDETGIISLVDDIDKKNTKLTSQVGAWKILLLDDKPEEAENLTTLLREAGIVVLEAKSFSEAQDKIYNDSKNEINVIISDYRLKDEKGYYKEKQGYSFIKWIALQNRFNELFILSGLSRNFLKKTFNEYGVRVHIESKNDIRGEKSENLTNFANKIIEKGNETCDIIQSLPEAKQWEELKRFYAYYRSLPNYEQIENTISIESKTMIDELLNAIESLPDRYSNLDDDKKRIELRKDIERTLKTCQIFKFKNLTAKTYTIDKETKLRIKKLPSETLDEFISKLIARRIAIFLHFRYGIKNYTIANFLKRGTAFEDEIEALEQKSKKIDRKITLIIKNSRSIHDIDLKTLKDLVEEKENFEKSNEQRKGDLKQIFFNLALQNTDYPGKLLVEERNWLMKFDLLQIRQAFDITNKMDSIIYDFLNSNLSKINIKPEQQYRNFRNQFQNVLKPSDKLTLGHKARCFYSLKKIKDAVETLLSLIHSIGTRKELLLKLLNELNNIDYSKDFILNKFYLFCNEELRRINH